MAKSKMVARGVHQQMVYSLFPLCPSIFALLDMARNSKCLKEKMPQLQYLLVFSFVSFKCLSLYIFPLDNTFTWTNFKRY